MQRHRRRGPSGNRPLWSYKPGDTSYREFSRSTSAYQQASGGGWGSVGAGVIRDSHYVQNPSTLLWERTTALEGYRDQFFTAPLAPATQTVSLDVGTYDVWVEGSGSLSLTGHGHAGTVVNAATPAVVTVTVLGNLTATKTGTLTVMQCQQRLTGPFRSTVAPYSSRGHELLAFNYTEPPTAEGITICLRFFEGGTVLSDNYGLVIQVGCDEGFTTAPSVLVYRNIDAGGGYRPSFRLSEGSFTVDLTGFPTPARGDLVEIVESAYWQGGLARHAFAQRITGSGGAGAWVTVAADSTTPRAVPATWDAQNITLGRAYSASYGFNHFTHAAIWRGVVAPAAALAATLAL